MPDPNLQFDPTDGWENTTTFPTSPTSQAQTRTMFQRLFTQIQTYLNTTYTSWINSTFATIANLNAAVLSGISDDSVTDAKLSATAGTVKDRVNTYLADGGITDAKLSGAAGTVKTLAAAHYIDYYKHGLTGTTDSSGSNTVYTLTPSPNALTAYAEYLKLSVVFDKANGGACTINVSGLGAKSIKKVESTGKVALVAGDILALVVTNLVYDGTDFIVLNPVINDIPKSLMTAAGDIVVASGANTPARLAVDATANKALVSNGTTVAYGYPLLSYYISSDVVLLTDNTERTRNGGTYGTTHTFYLGKNANTFKVKVEIKTADGNAAYFKVVDNDGNVLGSETNTNSLTYVSYEFTCSGYRPFSNAGGRNAICLQGKCSGTNGYVKNVTVCASETALINSL